MRRTRIAAAGLAVFAFGTMSWLATAFVPMVEQAPPQKVDEEGGICALPMTSADGLWTACVDAFGQVNYLATPDQPTTDNVFETLVYEASTNSGGVSRRVENNYVVSVGPNIGPDFSYTRLEKADGTGLSIEIINRMINGPSGGVQVQIHCENKGTFPIECKLFYYVDYDISDFCCDDEADAIFDATSRLVAIEQIDSGADPKPLWYGGCPNYKSWQIDGFPTLRNALDGGIPQLLSADVGPAGPGDNVAALSTDLTTLEPGQSATMEVGLGGPGFAKCKSKCPYDCDGTNDGIVGINDFLALLAQWGIPGAPCDKVGGDVGVGINDFLALLASWGPCPVNSVKCCLPIDLEAYCQDPAAGPPPEACVDADTCADCEALGGLCVEDCNLVEQTITIVDEDAPDGACRHSTWTALVCQPKAPCVCGNLIDALFTSATPCDPVQGSAIQFGNPTIPPLPPGFFGPGSDPFFGDVCLKGEPLPGFEVADTLVRRTSDPFQCDDPFPATAIVEIQIIELSLTSIEPIVVTENGGQNPQLWDVAVTLSQQAPQQPGVMQVEKLHQNGGRFISDLPVTPLLIFTQVGNPGNQIPLDLGGQPPIFLNNGAAPSDWVHDVKLGTLAPEGPPSCFNPGISEP